MELTVQNMYGLLIRSKLLSLDEARAAFARWQEVAGEGSGNVSAFALWLVGNRYLTDYQATLLARGHADGFFLGDYKILDRLGQGRMAGVFKGQHPLGQVVAIKVLPPSKARDPNLLGRFQREARLLLQLKHPNVVRAFQVGQAEQLSGEVLHYLVMEYLEGETLDEVIKRRGRMAPAEAVRLIYQALQGLQHIHAHGLVHRDIKPANLMLVGSSGDSTQRATLKILDLGLGRAMFDAALSELDDGLTGEGVLLGTPDYMAPEQARDARGIDIRADVYSLGCVLYQLLAGQLPFPDTNLINQMIRHATEQARPLTELNPAVPEGLQQIVNWMMAKDPNQRYPTPERAAQALQVFLAAGASESLVAPEADPRMRPYLTWLEGHGEKSEPSENHERSQTLVPQPRPVGPTVLTPPKPAARPSGTVPRIPKPEPPPVGPARQVGQEDVAAGPSPEARPATKERKKLPGVEKEDRPDRQQARNEKGKKPVPPNSPPPVPTTQEGEAPAGPDAEGFDVELMAGGEEAVPERDLFDLRLDRRDCLMLGLGIVAGGLAVGLGCSIAIRRMKKQPEPKTEEK